MATRLKSKTVARHKGEDDVLYNFNALAASILGRRRTYFPASMSLAKRSKR